MISKQRYSILNNIIFIEPGFCNLLEKKIFFNINKVVFYNNEFLDFFNLHDDLNNFNIKKILNINKSDSFGLNMFNEPIDNLFPSHITKIVFGHAFNQDVNNLPILLDTLFFGYNFNKTVDNLPSNLMCLIFSYSFNKCVENLPNSIIYLVFGKNFNQPLYNLPNSVKYLNLIYTINFEYMNDLPDFIEHLVINDKNPNKLPEKNKIVECHYNYQYDILIQTKFKFALNDIEFRIY